VENVYRDKTMVPAVGTYTKKYKHVDKSSHTHVYGDVSSWDGHLKE